MICIWAKFTIVFNILFIVLYCNYSGSSVQLSYYSIAIDAAILPYLLLYIAIQLLFIFSLYRSCIRLNATPARAGCMTCSPVNSLCWIFEYTITLNWLLKDILFLEFSNSEYTHTVKLQCCLQLSKNDRIVTLCDKHSTFKPEFCRSHVNLIRFGAILQSSTVFGYPYFFLFRILKSNVVSVLYQSQFDYLLIIFIHQCYW